jgi:hypothetical protein
MGHDADWLRCARHRGVSPEKECHGSRSSRLINVHDRSAVNISSFANGAFGEHRRHDTDGIRLEIEAPERFRCEWPNELTTAISQV